MVQFTTIIRRFEKQGEKTGWTYISIPADIAQQFLRVGLIDEIQINHVPILLGDGVRLFEHLGIKNSRLEKERVLDSPHVTHIRYRVVK